MKVKTLLLIILIFMSLSVNTNTAYVVMAGDTLIIDTNAEAKELSPLEEVTVRISISIIYEPLEGDSFVRRIGGQGTGIIVDGTHVLTNYHVIEKTLCEDCAFTIEVMLPSKARYRMLVEKGDEEQDLALLVIKSRMRFTAIPLKIASSLQLNDEVTVVGYPKAKYTVSSGKLSDIRIHKWAGYPDAIRIPVYVGFGSSGGGVVDSNGFLIGLIYAQESDPETIEHMFALMLTIDNIKVFLENKNS